MQKTPAKIPHLSWGFVENFWFLLFALQLYLTVKACLFGGFYLLLAAFYLGSYRGSGYRLFCLGGRRARYNRHTAGHAFQPCNIL